MSLHHLVSVVATQGLIKRELGERRMVLRECHKMYDPP